MIEDDFREIPTHQLGQLLIPDDDFNSWLRINTRQAMQRETGEISVTPTLLIIRPLQLQAGSFEERYQVTLCPLLVGDDWGDREVRWNIMREMGRQCAQRGEAPAAIFHVAEAWSKAIRTEEEAQQALWDTVASFPDKEEVLVVSGLSIDQRVNMALCKIERDPEDYMLFSEPNWMEYSAEEPVGQADMLVEFYLGFFEAIAQAQEGEK
jgi:hypothetical protein